MDIAAQLDATADALAAVDLDVLTDDELHRLTIDVRRALERMTVGVSRCLARWDVRQVWAADQSRSARARLSRELHCSPATAGRELRRARTLGRVPATTAAVRSGSLSMDHLDVLGAAETAHPDRFALDEELLVEQCMTVPLFAQATAIVAYWRQRADAAEPADATSDPDPDPDDGRSWHASTTFDGAVVVNGTLDAIGGAIYTGELDRLSEQIRLADERAGIVRTAARRRAAAQIEMATRSAAVPPGSRRPRPLFTALIGDDTVAHLCELANGRVLDPVALAPHLGTADLEVVLFDGPSTVLSVSHRRSFTGALRRAIQVRDRHCRHPSGCDVPAPACDVDHIVPWPASHRTDQFNGRLECPTHNRRSDRHDHGAQPPPGRDVTFLDTVRARLRWQYHHTMGDAGDDDDDTDADA